MSLTVLTLLGPVAGMAGADHDPTTREPTTCLAGLGPVVTEECKEDWVARLDGPGIVSGDTGKTVVVSPDGGIVATSASAGPGSEADLLVAAYQAATGHRLWTTQHTIGAPGDGLARDVAFHPTESILYAAGSVAATGDRQAVILAMDSGTGSVIWTASRDGPGTWDHAQALSTDGALVYVAGTTHQPGANFDVFVAAYEAATGEQAWIATYDGPGAGDDGLWRETLAVDPGRGLVYVALTSQGDGTSSDYATLALDSATGELVWEARHDEAGSRDEALSLALDPVRGAVYVTGYVRTGTERMDDFRTIAYDASDGSLLWTAAYNGPTNDEFIATRVVAAPGGDKVFIAGLSDGEELDPGWWDYAVVAYDATTGDEAWVARYSAPTNVNEVAWDLAVAPDESRVYATGESFGLATPLNNQGDILTAAFEADTGEQAWAARFDGFQHGWDVGQAVVVGPESQRVYVAGLSPGDDLGDGVVLAYDAYLDEADSLLPGIP